MLSVKGIIDKVASRKLAVTAGAGAAAATGAGVPMEQLGDSTGELEDLGQPESLSGL